MFVDKKEKQRRLGLGAHNPPKSQSSKFQTLHKQNYNKEVRVHINWSGLNTSTYLPVAVERKTKFRDEAQSKERRRPKGTKRGAGKPARTETIRKVQAASSQHNSEIVLAERPPPRTTRRPWLPPPPNPPQKPPVLVFLFQFTEGRRAKKIKKQGRKEGFCWGHEGAISFCRLASTLPVSSGFSESLCGGGGVWTERRCRR